MQSLRHGLVLKVRNCRAGVGAPIPSLVYLRTGSTPEEADIGVFNAMFPMQVGKEEDARAFAAETMGARRAEFEAHHARADTSRET